MWRDPYSYTLNFTGGNLVPLNGSIGLNVDIDRESDFALYRIAAIHTSPNYRVQIRDQDDRLILGGATPSVNIFGHGQWPYRLDAAKIVRRTNQIRVVLTDASGANNTVRLLFSGANLFSAPPFTIPQFVAVEPFVLTFNYGGEVTDDLPAIAANGALPGSRRTPGDSWFECYRLTLSATSVTAAAGGTLQIATNAFREWFRNPVHFALLGGCDFVGNYQGIDTPNNPHAPFAFEFNPPKLLPPSTQVSFTVADLSGAPLSCRITLHGLRRYTAEQVPG
ncbi:MAG: hypothetical protein AUG85_08270 [Gemmatimonadetes bacterium 13_1_20CM_4_66_11]|nr:MAG: hypothetical protein AUI86_11780 [Gemmatimonadetes bacterium 13_1_40CM_3_66_12]OLD87074.1 MAG: hypothetical protein AUG85_08270 [Gemmatimonadetes bacterium 13_1_20CM_4_66_11]